MVSIAGCGLLHGRSVSLIGLHYVLSAMNGAGGVAVASWTLHGVLCAKILTREIKQASNKLQWWEVKSMTCDMTSFTAALF